MDDIDTQELLDSIEKPAEDRPMGGETAPEPETPAAPEPPAWKGDEWAFDFNGKRVVPTSVDQLRVWASQGHNYSQRAAELNKREASFKDLEGKYKPYAEVDDYATKNPEWWQHVQESYAKRGQEVPDQVNQLPPELQAALKPFQEKLSQVDAFLQQQQQAREAEQQEALLKEQTRQDEALSTAIEEIRAKHPNIDLNARDESGETLEYRVLKHAAENGIGTFRAAFRDYLHDQLVESEKANAERAKLKAGEQEKRQGLLGRSPTPKKVPDDAPANVRGKSYEDITRDIHRELGITA
jgi:hypothetical protein